MTRVRGTQDMVREWEFDIDTIYHRTNIQRIKEIDKITEEEREYWEYNETQYNSMEFAEFLNNQKNTIEKLQGEQNTAIIDNTFRIDLLEMGIDPTTL